MISSTFSPVFKTTIQPSHSASSAHFRCYSLTLRTNTRKPLPTKNSKPSSRPGFGQGVRWRQHRSWRRRRQFIKPIYVQQCARVSAWLCPLGCVWTRGHSGSRLVLYRLCAQRIGRPKRTPDRSTISLIKKEHRSHSPTPTCRPPRKSFSLSPFNLSRLPLYCRRCVLAVSLFCS